jgi:RimJ/RimL family protein N-acetyltransferase
MEQRIQLRPWKKEDAGQLTSIANNKKIWLNVRDHFPHPYTVSDALKWVEHTSTQLPPQNMAITVDDNIAGGIGLILKEDVYRKSIEIGYFLGEQYWGKGIATKAVAILLNYIGEHFDVVRVYAEVFAYNTASMRVLEKNGFHLESVREKAVIKNKVIMDDYVWVKLLK